MARLTRGWVAWMLEQLSTGSANMKMTISIWWEPRRGTAQAQTAETDPTTGLDGAHARKVTDWTTLDLILNYTFNYPAPAPAEVPGYAKDGGKNVKMKDGKDKNVVPVSTAEYGCHNWQWWLNNITVTLGMQNVLDQDPPFVAGNFENGYDESLDHDQRPVLVRRLKKRF